MPKFYKKNKKHINPRYFLNEISDLDFESLVKRYIYAELDHKMSSGAEKDKALQRLRSAHAALSKIPPEYAQKADDIAFELRDQIKKDQDARFAATSNPKALGPGDIDLDKI